MFKKLASQIKTKASKQKLNSMSSPFDEDEDVSILKKLSKHALSLYERQSDIKNFTKIVLSDPENTSHNDRIKEIYGDKNPFEEEAMFELSENKRFLDDLGL